MRYFTGHWSEFAILCLLVIALTTCSSSSSPPPHYTLDNRRFQSYARADSFIEVQHAFTIPAEIIQRVGFDPIAFVALDSLLILTDRTEGIAAYDNYGGLRWQIEPSILSSTEWSPLLYSFYDDALQEICALTGDRKLIRCFDLNGLPTSSHTVKAPHAHAVRTANGNLLLETYHKFPSGQRFGESYTLSEFADAEFQQPYVPVVRRDIGEVDYRHARTIYQKDEDLFYSRPYTDRVDRVDTGSGSLQSHATYNFTERHPPASYFADPDYPNAVKAFAEENFVRPTWVFTYEGLMVACYDYNNQSNFLIADTATTFLNTNLLVIDKEVVPSPRMFGDAGALLSYFTAAQHELLEELWESDLRPSQNWREKVSRLKPPSKEEPLAIRVVLSRLRR